MTVEMQAAGTVAPAGPATGTGAGIESGSTSPEPFRILIVEDDPMNRFLFARAAEACGAVCHEANCVSEALTLLRLHHYDIALVDCHLPDGHGSEVAEAAVAQGGDIEVIAVSSDDTVENTSKILRAGAARFLQKPLSMRELSRTLLEFREGLRTLRR